jgi:methylenetetrahydrofolate reductase (NADPH)
MTALTDVLPERHKRRVAELVATASIEVSPNDKLICEGLCDLFPAGTTVFVNHPSSADYHDIIGACVRLRRGGFEPVPHIAARRLTDVEGAVNFLRRVTDEADVIDVLLIGGDPDWPTGPFRDSLTLLASGLLECHGIERVRFAGYPEGHPLISAAALDRALAAKLAVANERGLVASLVTQFCFEAAPIEAWIARLRDRGIDCPVRIGVAGPARAATLVKFGVRCGIGSSLRALARGYPAFARVLTEAGPDALIDALVAREIAIDSLHIFTFGGVLPTAGWRRQKLK